MPVTVEASLFHTPAHDTDNPRWVHADDCRNVMRAMQENSISLIVTDPPYFIDGMGDDWDHGALARRMRGCGVVKSLPIGMKFDRSQGPRL